MKKRSCDSFYKKGEIFIQKTIYKSTINSKVKVVKRTIKLKIYIKGDKIWITEKLWI